MAAHALLLPHQQLPLHASERAHEMLFHHLLSYHVLFLALGVPPSVVLEPQLLL